MWNVVKLVLEFTFVNVLNKENNKIKKLYSKILIVIAAKKTKIMVGKKIINNKVCIHKEDNMKM